MIWRSRGPGASSKLATTCFVICSGVVRISPWRNVPSISFSADRYWNPAR